MRFYRRCNTGEQGGLIDHRHALCRGHLSNQIGLVRLLETRQHIGRRRVDFAMRKGPGRVCQKGLALGVVLGRH